MRKKPSDGKPKGAYERAVGLLARREHSSRELKLKLAQRGIEASEADATITRLRREDYQSALLETASHMADEWPSPVALPSDCPWTLDELLAEGEGARHWKPI